MASRVSRRTVRERTVSAVAAITLAVSMLQAAAPPAAAYSCETMIWLSPYEYELFSGTSWTTYKQDAWYRYYTLWGYYFHWRAAIANGQFLWSQVGVDTLACASWRVLAPSSATQ